MGEEVAERDRRRRWSEDRLFIGIEAVEHGHCAELGAYVGRWCVEIEKPLLDELHGSHPGNRLRHRGDLGHRVERHPNTRANVALAERAFVAHTVGGHGYRDDTRYPLLVDAGLQELIDCFAHRWRA